MNDYYYSVQRTGLPPYYAGANPVERVNSSLNPTITTFVEDNHRTWDKHLHEFHLGLNAVTHSGTIVSSAFLNYGRHPDQPKSLRRDNESHDIIQKIDEQWIEQLKKLSI